MFKDVIVEPESFVNDFKLLESNVNSKMYEDMLKITNGEKFYFEIENLKNVFAELIFLSLYEFATYTLHLSRAYAERISSKISPIKNRLANRLKIETCESMLSSLNLIESKLEK